MRGRVTIQGSDLSYFSNQTSRCHHLHQLDKLHYELTKKIYLMP